MVRKSIAAVIVALGIAVPLAGCAGAGSSESGNSGTDRNGKTIFTEGTVAHGGDYVAKTDAKVRNVVGMHVEAACRELVRGGHGGMVEDVKRVEGTKPGYVVAQDRKPGSKPGFVTVVGLTVSGPFSEKELSPDTHCSDPEPEN